MLVSETTKKRIFAALDAAVLEFKGSKPTEAEMGGMLLGMALGALREAGIPRREVETHIAGIIAAVWR